MHVQIEGDKGDEGGVASSVELYFLDVGCSFGCSDQLGNAGKRFNCFQIQVVIVSNHSLGYSACFSTRVGRPEKIQRKVPRKQCR